MNATLHPVHFKDGLTNEMGTQDPEAVQVRLNLSGTDIRTGRDGQHVRFCFLCKIQCIISMGRNPLSYLSISLNVRAVTSNIQSLLWTVLFQLVELFWNQEWQLI